MAKRKVAPDNSRGAQPVCRLVSLLPDSAAQRESSDKPMAANKIAAGIAMIMLLGFAGIGIVFTLKYRDPKSESRPVVELVENKNLPSAPVLSRSSPQPKFITQPATSTTKLPSPSLIPPVVPAVEPAPAEIRTENLAIPPREFSDSQSTNVPPVAIDDKPRPDSKGESTRAPDRPVATIPESQTEKPRVQAPKKFPDTEPANDPQLPTFGTRIGFHPTSADAFEAAKKDKEKLVMVVHYAGLFEEGAFLSTAVETFRQNCLLNPDVTETIRHHFICSATKIATSRNVNGRMTGSIVIYFCLSNGSVLHAISGPVNAEEFLREVEWLLAIRKTAAAEYLKDPTKYGVIFRNAHAERYFKYAEYLPMPEAALIPALARPMFIVIPGLPPGFFPKGKGLPGPPMIIQIPVPDLPSVAPVVQPPKLPAKCPAELDAQAKVHWLLARQSLPELKDVYVRVYSEFLKEPIAP